MAAVVAVGGLAGGLAGGVRGVRELLAPAPRADRLSAPVGPAPETLAIPLPR